MSDQITTKNVERFYVEKRIFSNVTALRGVAVLSVILFHLYPKLIPGGFSGVDVFFVISGFVVTHSSLNAWQNNFTTISIAQFFARRALRLLPTLIVVLLVTTVVYVIFTPPTWVGEAVLQTGTLAFFALSNFFLASNQVGYFDVDTSMNPFTHTWSLAVEEQFYFIFPIIFLISILLRMPQKKALAFTTFFMGAISFLFMVAFSQQEGSYYLGPGRAWEFAVGILLRVFYVNYAKSNRRNLSILGALGATLLILSFTFADKNHFPFPWSLAPVIATGLLIIWATTAQSGRRYRHKPLIYVGRISYSLYLWHWPVFVMFRWTIGLDDLAKQLCAVLIAFILSVLTFNLLEKPFSKRKQFLTSKPLLVLACATVTLVIGANFSGQVIRNHPNFAIGTLSNQKMWYPNPWPSKNTDRKELAGKSMYVIGDSHSSAYAYMFQMLRDRDGLDVTEFSEPGCAYLALQLDFERQEPKCKSFFQNSLELVRSEINKGDVLFLPGLRIPRLMTSSDILSPKDVIGEVYSREAEKVRMIALREAMTEIENLREFGVEVIIEAPKPVFMFEPYRCSDWFNEDNPRCVKGAMIDRNVLTKLRDPVLLSMQTLQKNFDFVTIWDPFEILCISRQCNAFSQGKPLFKDSDHLSGFGNEVVYPSFRSNLLSLYSKAAAVH